MQAIILAAGMGRRLKGLTKHNTKCMVKVNGVTLIERMLHQIERRHLSRIVIVVGYKGQELMDFIRTLDIQTPIVYVNNPVYSTTNNIYSLSLAKEFLRQDDTLLFESDLIFDDSVIDWLLDDPRDTLALVDKYESWMDGTCMKLGEDDSIEAFLSNKNFKYSDVGSYYKTVNIYKFSKDFSDSCYIPFLDAYTTVLGNCSYYEQVLKVITMLDESRMKAKRLDGQPWYEIDDVQDLDIASSLFASTEEEKVSMLQKRYGGYWRYPHMVDFCYLVNPYFPPQRMLDEIEANFGKLLSQYPSGMMVNSLLAAKNFGVEPANILAGNGASELIKLLMDGWDGKTGFIRPSFEEYPNRYPGRKSVFYTPENENFTYTAQDLIEFFRDKEIKNMVVINPDNPSGNYICKADLIKLVGWAENNHINMIIDESFVDFADERCTLIHQDILDENPHLCVVKSISKCCGVPGLRLGVAASGNTALISELKKEVSIWNINSFAEFYMQIEEKYKDDYLAALERLKCERNRFIGKLEEIPGIRVIPSQADYLMVELTNGMTAKELTGRLLADHELLIKDLSQKIPDGQFVRLAIRNTEDNNALISALKNICIL